MALQESVKDILTAVGGQENIVSLQHCSTRLRFNVADTSKVDRDALENNPDVLGVVTGPQTQVVIGNKVIEFYNEANKHLGNSDNVKAEKQPLTINRAGSIALDFIVSVFVPIIPAIAGAGVFKAMLVLFTTFGWMDKTGSNYLLLVALPDAVFAFLPVLVAYTTARKLNVNIPLALGIVGIFLFPTFTTLMATEGGIALWGFPVTKVAYSAQVFPAIITVLLLWPVEKFFNKVTPGPIRVFFVPMMCLLIVGPIAILALGPLGYGLGVYLTAFFIWLHGVFGWFAVATLAAFLPLIVSVGMHKALLPPTINQITTTGSESLYMGASLPHNIAESGMSLAVALRTKSKRLRATSISASISAFFGITEPALYGVTIQNKRALYSVMIGAFAGGAWMGINHVAAFVPVGPGIASMPIYISPTDSSNIVNAFISLAISFIVAFAAAFFLWSDDKSTTVQKEREAEAKNASAAADLGDNTDDVLVQAPVAGKVLPLAEVNDSVFSTGILGEGVAIVPENGTITAPISGKITSLLPSKHAFGIRSESGSEVLVHVGFDTVSLQGKYFTALKQQGDTVVAGEPVIQADLESIKAEGYETTTPVVLVNASKFDIHYDAVEDTQAGQALFTATRKVATTNGIS